MDELMTEAEVETAVKSVLSGAVDVNAFVSGEEDGDHDAGTTDAVKLLAEATSKSDGSDTGFA